MRKGRNDVTLADPGQTRHARASAGRAVAERLNAPLEVCDDLHENDRTGLGWLGSEELEATIARFFAAPDQRTMGHETADEAYARFAAAVEDVCLRHPVGNIAIVAHGTVITLFVSRRTGLEPFPFWMRLGLPSFVLLLHPDHAVQTIVEDIAEDE